MTSLNIVKKFADEHNIEINEKQYDQLEKFCEYLIEKNKVMNLTAIESPEQIEIKHLIDSIAGKNIIDNYVSRETFSLIDIGCGAGFPGIPLKVLYPAARFILLDSLNKRINFVNETSKLLGLENIEGIAARAEDLAKTEERENFDICVSRAVANMNVLLEYCMPFVKVGGYCVMYKAGACEEEVEASKNVIELLGGQLEKIEKFELPGNEGERAFVIIKKNSSTPEKYPRRAGMPTKKPLK